MVKTNVKVFVRTRPTAANFDGLKAQPDAGVITLKVPKSEDMGIINNQQENFTFKFDGILENVSQETMYTSTAHEVVDSLLSGINGTVFCYGQTGSGKTFTMSGDLRNYQHRGLIPRAIHHVFRQIDMRADKIYKVHVSYLEIYNDQLYDLLSDHPASNDALAILEDGPNGTYVRGLVTAQVGSEEEALAQYFAGEQGRSTAGHVLNSSSSRSHCVFTLHVEMRHSEAASERAVLSKLHLVDLAGSERTKKTAVSGVALKEAQFINKSLSFLEQTVNALSRRDAYVPFRQSKLTAVLRDALGGNCKTVMIANIWGEPRHMEETLSTLRFASRVKTLVTDVAVNESSDPSLLLRRYERQIKELKQELAMRDALSGRSRINYDDLSDAEVRELNSLCRRFLQGEADLEELPTDTLRRIKEGYKQMRNVFQAMRSELAEQIKAGASSTAAAVVQNGDSSADAGAGVGDVDTSGRGFQVGTAPAEARPSTREPTAQSPHRPGPMSLTSTASPTTGGVGYGGYSSGDDALAAGGTSGVMGSAERNAAFHRFKHEIDEGRALASIVKERSEQLRELKANIKEATASVNSAKASIDSLTSRLASKRAGTAGGGAPLAGGDDILDAEQHGLMAELKAAKAAYRQEFERLKEMRSFLEPSLQGVAEAKQNLVDEFNKWVGSPQGTFTLAQPADDDELDPGEAFERMQFERIVAADPESSAYHAAQRKTSTIRTSQAAFGGVKGAAVAMRKKEHEQAIAAGLARH